MFVSLRLACILVAFLFSTWLSAQTNEKDTDLDTNLCAYSKTWLKPMCHVCNRKDKVGRVVYGDAPVLKGNNVAGGCIVHDCQAKWWCIRDNAGVLK